MAFIYRIADGLKDAMVKCFRILAKWLVIPPERWMIASILTETFHCDYSIVNSHQILSNYPPRSKIFNTNLINMA